LIVANGNQRDAFILSQTSGGTEADPIFAFNPYGVMYVNLDQGAGASITAAPAGTSADIDGDGDDDLIYVDDVGRKIVLVSDTFDEDEQRVSVAVVYPYLQGQEFVFELDAWLPESAELFSVEAWFQSEGLRVETPA
jgi:hypothetical protein